MNTWTRRSALFLFMILFGFVIFIGAIFLTGFLFIFFLGGGATAGFLFSGFFLGVVAVGFWAKYMTDKINAIR